MNLRHESMIVKGKDVQVGDVLYNSYDPRLVVSVRPSGCVIQAQTKPILVRGVDTITPSYFGCEADMDIMRPRAEQ